MSECDTFNHILHIFIIDNSTQYTNSLFVIHNLVTKRRLVLENYIGKLYILAPLNCSNI